MVRGGSRHGHRWIGEIMAANAISRRAQRGQRSVLRSLSALLGDGNVLVEPEQTGPFECDGLSAFRQRPLAVALPDTEDQVRGILRICSESCTPVVARGAGTGLSGGAMPCADGILLSLAKLNCILQIDPVACTARVQPGVRNLA